MRFVTLDGTYYRMGSLTNFCSGEIQIHSTLCNEQNLRIRCERDN